MYGQLGKITIKLKNVLGFYIFVGDREHCVMHIMNYIHLRFVSLDNFRHVRIPLVDLGAKSKLENILTL